MDKQSNLATRKGLILLLGILIGMLVGLFVAFLLIDKISELKEPIVKQEIPQKQTPPNDTIVKYVVHKYEPNSSQNSSAKTDSLNSDSLDYYSKSVDFLLDDDEEIKPLEFDKTNVSESKIIHKHDCNIVFLDANKNVVEPVENIGENVEVQFWSTPIKNKISYSFDKNVLKIKGLQQSDNVAVYYYKENYYLSLDKRTYLITPSKESRRLLETHAF